MLTGIVFDINEFAVHDGPGLRTTIFLKGCPLRCQWCHNPEGLLLEPQEMAGPTGKRTVGKKYTSAELADLILPQAEMFRASGGGVTFSGGEPLSQAPFVAEVISRIQGVHVLLDTSGYSSEETFRTLVPKVNLVYFDLKIISPSLHKRYTGADNALILNNLRVLSTLDVPYVVRIPLVPGVTDTSENLEAVAGFVRNLPGLTRVDLLSYNKSAGGKYRACGMDFKPEYDEQAPVNADVSAFNAANIPVRVA